MAQYVQNPTAAAQIAAETWVPSLTWHRKLKCCCSCGIGHSSSSDFDPCPGNFHMPWVAFKNKATIMTFVKLGAVGSIYVLFSVLFFLFEKIPHPVTVKKTRNSTGRWAGAGLCPCFAGLGLGGGHSACSPDVAGDSCAQGSLPGLAVCPPTPPRQSPPEPRMLTCALLPSSRSRRGHAQLGAVGGGSLWEGVHPLDGRAALGAVQGRPARVQAGQRGRAVLLGHRLRPPGVRARELQRRPHPPPGGGL